MSTSGYDGFFLPLEIAKSTGQNIWSSDPQDTGHQITKESEPRETKDKWSELSAQFTALREITGYNAYTEGGTQVDLSKL